ncbi:hypothetical protein Tco_1065042 [Tanacetum coccineum]
MFIKYSTSQIPPKKSRGKGLQGNKSTDTHMADVVMSEESNPEPSRKKTSTKRRFRTESEYSKEDQFDEEEKDVKEGDVDDEGDDHISDIQDTDNEDDETEFDEDKIYMYRYHKAELKRLQEVKDVAKKTELPPTSSSLSVSLGFGDLFLKLSSDFSSSSLSVSSGFGDQFLKLSSDSSLVSTVKDTTDAEINSLLKLRVAKLEKDVFDLKKLYLSVEALVALRTEVPSVVDNYLGSKKIHKSPKKQTPIVDLEQELEKTPSEILKIKKEQAEKQKMPKFTIKSTDKVALNEYD